MLTIINAEYLEDYKVRLTFNNGECGIVDFKEILLSDSRTIFNELNNIEYFKNFKLKLDTLVWENELDFAPEYLFYKMRKNDPIYAKQFQEWGYIN